jgi:hypothetical protein
MVGSGKEGAGIDAVRKRLDMRLAAGKSPLYRWLVKNFDEVAPFLPPNKPARFAAVAADDGVQVSRQQVLSAWGRLLADRPPVMPPVRPTAPVHGAGYGFAPQPEVHPDDDLFKPARLKGSPDPDDLLLVPFTFKAPVAGPVPFDPADPFRPDVTPDDDDPADFFKNIKPIS